MRHALLAVACALLSAAGGQYIEYGRGYYASAGDHTSEVDEKIRLLDEKLSLQLKQQVAILRERIEELERHVQELRRLSMSDWNATDSGSSYKVFTVRKSWDDAQSVCKAYGASLAVVDSDYKNAYVRGNPKAGASGPANAPAPAEMLLDHLGASASEQPEASTAASDEGPEMWIGLKTKAEISGAAGSRYSNFYEEEKADGCTVMDAQGKWKTRPCRVPRPFVCQQINVR